MTETAVIYGGSLYELAAEEGDPRRYLEELNQVLALFEQDPAYYALIGEPSLPREERCGLLDQAFRGQVEPYLLNFLKLLCERSSITELPGCTRQFRTLYNKNHGITEARVTSAVPLSEDQRARLLATLKEKTGGEIDLIEKVDPALLGGIRLDMEDHRYDGSVHGRLNRMHESLSNIVL